MINRVTLIEPPDLVCTFSLGNVCDVLIPNSCYYTPKKKGQKIIRAMIKPIQYRTNRFDTFFINHSESAMPIPRNVAIMAVTTVKKTPSAIVLLFMSNNFQSFFYHVVITENDALGFLYDHIRLNTDPDKFSAIGKFLVSGAYSTGISPT